MSKSNQPNVNLWISTLIPSAAIPIVLAILAHVYLSDFHWVHLPFHSLLESLGAFAAILLAVFIITMRRHHELRSNYIWVATALVAMGIFDGFHASVSPGKEFVWLHSLSTFFGGLLFAMVALPDHINGHNLVQKAPCIIGALAITIGLASILYPGWIPSMMTADKFTSAAVFLNTVGGIGFVIAWFYFVRSDLLSDPLERQLLANHTLLFGGAALLFQFSMIWDATWWLWHLLRLLAYLVILGFFLKIYFDTVAKIKDNEQRLLVNQMDLQKERSLISGIIENSPSLITLKDFEGRYILANTPFYKLLGVSPQEVIGHTPKDFLDPTTHEMDLEWDQEVLNANHSIEKEIDYTIHNKTYTFLSSRFPLKNSRGEIYAIGSIHTDISKRKEMEQRLELSKNIIDHTNEGIIVTNPDQIITEINSAYSHITGYSSHELVGKKPNFLQSNKHDEAFYFEMWQQLVHTGHWSGEIWDRKKDGSIFPQWLSITAIYNQNKQVEQYVGIMHDITQKKAVESQLQQLAYNDPLTGLPNRALFKERLGQNLLTCQRLRANLDLLLLDLDDFKTVNDSLGHDAGDELLIQAGQRIRQCLRSSDTVARLGGDEFVIILSQIQEPIQASLVCSKIIDAFKEPFTINQAVVNVSSSIGIASYPQDGEDVEALVKNADLALYKAKDSGRNTFEFFSSEMQEKVNENLKLKNEILEAIELQQFEVFYQPKVDLVTQEIMGMEALVRWNHPEKGLIPPFKFIPFAEQNGSIIQIGEQVLNQACAQVKQWQAEFNKPFKLAVNLSTMQFKDAGLINSIKNSIEQNQFNYDLLELEITESMVMQEVEEAIAIMHHIHDLGIHIAIDDFGTGYSSLGYLKRFPIHTIKIDRSFVKDITTDPGDRAIIDSIILLSEKLQYEVVAEGIETIEQMDFLKSKNCHIGQGYLFSQPLNSDDFSQYLGDYFVKH